MLRADGPDGAYVLVVEGASSSMVPLPKEGTVLIGRAPECAVRLNDVACSRRQANLHISDGEVRLEDLGSHNGTRVNGERISGTRALASDDIIAVGPVKIIVHAAPRPQRPATLDAAALRDRLAQEIARASAFERPLSVLVLALNGAELVLAVNAVSRLLRAIDIVGRIDDRHLAIILPEVGVDAAGAMAERLATAATRLSSAVGLAHCPSEGCNALALLASARAAADHPDGGIRQASACVTELSFDGDGDGATAVVADPAMVQLFDLLRRLAASELTVLVAGETGVGKENGARAVHLWSPRAAGPFVAINCASLPEALVESELFGYEKGAFSGAATAKPGRLEAAAGGTVFFDEIGELPLGAQAKLLRALESRRATRLGALKDYDLDVRIVAATNRDLPAEVKAGRFREDLYFRLGGAKVIMPPLRDRPRELALLSQLFLARACAAAQRVAPTLSAGAMAALERHPWPGNVRELKN